MLLSSLVERGGATCLRTSPPGDRCSRSASCSLQNRTKSSREGKRDNVQKLLIYIKLLQHWFALTMAYGLHFLEFGYMTILVFVLKTSSGLSFHWAKIELIKLAVGQLVIMSLFLIKIVIFEKFRKYFGLKICLQICLIIFLTVWKFSKLDAMLSKIFLKTICYFFLTFFGEKSVAIH